MPLASPTRTSAPCKFVRYERKGGRGGGGGRSHPKKVGDGTTYTLYVLILFKPRPPVAQGRFWLLQSRGTSAEEVGHFPANGILDREEKLVWLQAPLAPPGPQLLVQDQRSDGLAKLDPKILIRVGALALLPRRLQARGHTAHHPLQKAPADSSQRGVITLPRGSAAEFLVVTACPFGRCETYLGGVR